MEQQALQSSTTRWYMLAIALFFLGFLGCLQIMSDIASMESDSSTNPRPRTRWEARTLNSEGFSSTSTATP